MRRLLLCGLGLVLSGVAGMAFAKEADFEGQDVRKRDFSAQVLEGANFTDANCFLTNFKDCKLAGAKFDDADVTSATFDGADLKGASFLGATVKNAAFQGADLSKANFSGVDLSTVSFQNSKLRGANFRNTKGPADVTRADLREADLRGANLLSMKDYGGATAKFKGAKYDKATRWPLGFDVKGSGAVLAKEEKKPAAEEPDADDTEDEGAAEKPKAESKPKATKERTTKKPAGKPSDTADDDDDAAAEGDDPEKDEVDPKAPAGSPSLTVVKKLLETGIWGPPAENTDQAYTYKSIKYGEPFYKITVFKGASGEERDTKKVLRFPVKVKGEIEVISQLDGTSRVEAKDQTFHFFQDEFGDWSFKFQQNN